VRLVVVVVVGVVVAGSVVVVVAAVADGGESPTAFRAIEAADVALSCAVIL